jgi:hypothetical protein
VNNVATRMANRSGLRLDDGGGGGGGVMNGSKGVCTRACTTKEDGRFQTSAVGFGKKYSGRSFGLSLPSKTPLAQVTVSLFFLTIFSSTEQSLQGSVGKSFRQNSRRRYSREW